VRGNIFSGTQLGQDLLGQAHGSRGIVTGLENIAVGPVIAPKSVVAAVLEDVPIRPSTDLIFPMTVVLADVSVVAPKVDWTACTVVII